MHAWTVCGVVMLGLVVASGATAHDATQEPLPPWGLIAVPIDGAVYLTWQAPLSDGGAPVLEYRVYRDDGAGGWIGIGATDATQFVDDLAGAPLGPLLVYTVTAVNAAGESLPSGPAATLSGDCVAYDPDEFPPVNVYPEYCVPPIP